MLGTLPVLGSDTMSPRSSSGSPILEGRWVLCRRPVLKKMALHPSNYLWRPRTCSASLLVLCHQQNARFLPAPTAGHAVLPISPRHITAKQHSFCCRLNTHVDASITPLLWGRYQPHKQPWT
jgi:hypothetical protein